MSVLKYRCPTTSHEVATAIDTDRDSVVRMKALKVSVACPYCPEGHRIAANEMFFSSPPP
jgi:hypothetical protein